MDVVELDKRAAQVGFAALVGVSRAAVVKHIDNGTLKRNGTYRDWLHAYCQRLGESAGGRTGEDQQALTQARTRESLAKAESQELANYKEFGQVVLVEDIGPALVAMVELVRTQVLDAVEKAIERFESKKKVAIADKDFSAPVRLALENSAARAIELGKAIGRDMPSSDTGGSASDR